MTRLKKKMAENRVTLRELAAVAGTSVFKVWLKRQGVLEWELHEVVRICAFFREKDAEDLFYN